ncbi:MeTHuselah like protein [Ditylenchus destructor]|uniref:MeTHuselah like protein n=1 Tax=Ditylenchus destructor TaxID=166010 RepID=A0AAD4MU46_9BILA|nr:MeTHuselah like protein [Ditylenchus destructor]
MNSHSLLFPHFSCWIRPDYILPAVVMPLSLLCVNSIFTFFTILIRFLSQDNFIAVPFRFGSVRTIVWGSTSTSSTTTLESTNSSASSISIGMKNMEKALVIFCVQLMLGIPWLCQYFTLFAPQLTLAHYVFTIVIGGHGMTFLMLFWYRKLRKHCV